MNIKYNVSRETFAEQNKKIKYKIKAVSNYIDIWRIVSYNGV